MLLKIQFICEKRCFSQIKTGLLHKKSGYARFSMHNPTWNNKNIKGKVPRTFEEDLEMSTTEELYDNESESDDSDSEERPQLIGTKPKNTEIIL